MNRNARKPNHMFKYCLITLAFSAIGNAAMAQSNDCGVKVTSAVAYSIADRFKIEFTNTHYSKTVSTIEFRILIRDGFDKIIGEQTEIWEEGMDSPIKPGKSEYILRKSKTDDMSRVSAYVVRVRYSDGSKCYED